MPEDIYGECIVSLRSVRTFPSGSVVTFKSVEITSPVIGSSWAVIKFVCATPVIVVSTEDSSLESYGSDSNVAIEFT